MGHQGPLQATEARRRIAMAGSRDGLDRVRQARCEPTRLRIVAAPNGAESIVGELAAASGRTVSAASRHLRLLRRLGIVAGERLGTTVCYRLKPGEATDQVQSVLAALQHQQSAAS